MAEKIAEGPVPAGSRVATHSQGYPPSSVNSEVTVTEAIAWEPRGDDLTREAAMSVSPGAAAPARPEERRIGSERGVLLREDILDVLLEVSVLDSLSVCGRSTRHLRIALTRVLI